MIYKEVTNIIFSLFSGDYNNVIKTFTYRSTVKIPLLSDALKELKGTNLLVYIEVKISSLEMKISAQIYWSL